MLTRTEIINSVQAALEPLPFVHAMWEGGSAAFGRLDELSDLDLCIDVDAAFIETALILLEEALDGLGRVSGVEGPSIARRYRLPEPAWHGHTQVFYEISGAGPFLMLDVVLLKHNEGMRFSERELHGEPIVYFDKADVVQVTELDWDGHREKLRNRVEQLADSFHLFQPLVRKELLRGDGLAAMAYYQGLTIRPLVELLRILHDPARHGFHLRYLKHDLPPEGVERLEKLCFVGGLHELKRAHEQACVWFDELLPEAQSKWAG